MEAFILAFKSSFNSPKLLPAPAPLAFDQTCQPGWGQLLATGKWGEKLVHTKKLGQLSLKQDSLIKRISLFPLKFRIIVRVFNSISRGYTDNPDEATAW